MQKPSNLKHAKSQKGRLNFAIRLDRLCYGDFALMANQPARLNSSQLSAAILAIKRLLKKEGSPILRIFTHTPVTRKPSEVRMGKGKGSVEYWVAQIQPGKVLFEMEGVTRELAIEAFDLAKAKLPFKVAFEERKVM